MLKRTKYSRLRNDSLTSLEDLPQRMLPLKRNLCLDSDFAQLDSGTPTHDGPSTLRDFIPRVANIRLQSPITLQGLRGQTKTTRDRTTDGHTHRTDWGSEPNQRFCSQPSLSMPLSTGQNLTHSALECTKRPITLHRMTSLPWTPSCPPCSQHRDGLCCLKTSTAVDDCTVERTANRAVHHNIKYMGSVEVTQSMRTLDFDTRMQVTRFEHTSTKSTVTHLLYSRHRVTKNKTLLRLSSLPQKIAHHPMQAISFASGGDPDMRDYIAYVAKDFFNQRACHILECPQGRASEVINSIGQAFETRFRQLLSHTPSLLSTNPRSAVRICDKWSPEETIMDQKAKLEGEVSEHHDYYNMIPGKTPPAGGIEDLRITREENKQDAIMQGKRLQLHLQVKIIKTLLAQVICMHVLCTTTQLCVSLWLCACENGNEDSDSVASGVSAEQCSLFSEIRIQDLIQEEGWFHGRLGREQAESLLTCSGDFLVRESSSASGQYVLSGMEGATVRHLLLVDPHGQVRTRDQVFLSVGHLVRFHMENQMPIVSGSSELCLKQPVLQRH
ncbi:SHC-transforming protein 1 [Collichthys lucidus]|uniref:SHC-transforming protein 1 n=1 Tax=Collichthys lucidus TaxID=240159 RepID=A0A4U5U651_COLLU|nr:SHC-transforming protein 1 [Collichthys lucidus]